MADKGFTISGEFQNVGLHLNLPSFVNSGIQMCQADVEITQKNCSPSFSCWKGNWKIRTFKILSGCIPTSLFGSINKIWTVCVLRTPWQNPVLKNKWFCLLNKKHVFDLYNLDSWIVHVCIYMVTYMYVICWFFLLDDYVLSSVLYYTPDSWELTQASHHQIHFLLLVHVLYSTLILVVHPMTSAFDVIVLSTRVLYCYMYINSDVIESGDDFFNRINKIYNLSDNSYTWI